MKKQSSIEWLVEQLESANVISKYAFLEIINQANEMHKQETVNFARECLNKAKDTDILTSFMNVEHHYKNTHEK